MTRSLTPKTTLETLRKDAKRWLKALHAGDGEARARLAAAWPRAPAQPVLRDIQHALALEYGETGWTALKAALDDLALDRQSRRDRADALLRHGWGGELSIAQRILKRDPAIARDSLATAVVCGDIEEVDRRLVADPDSADRRTGPLNWTPLLYLAYSRLPGPGADNAVAIARRLLDLGADPNAEFNDGWDNAFKVLTGIIGQGEGNRPPHAQVGELASLLLERGAGPYDTQALYNTSITDDDPAWLRLLYWASEQKGEAERWHDASATPRLGGRIQTSTINYLLGNAVGQNHLKRAEWLLGHGADGNTPHAYELRPVHAVAQLSGFTDMAALLERHGAKPVPLNGADAFQAACLSGDEAAVRTLAMADPALLADPRPLLAAAMFGKTPAATLLLSLGADPMGLDPDGISPLHRAVQADSVEITEVLLAAGADPDLRERKWNGTPLSWCAVLGRPRMAERLAPVSRDVGALASLGLTERLDAVLDAEPDRANAWRDSGRLAKDERPTPLFCLPDDEDLAVAIADVLLRHDVDTAFRNPAGQTAADAARKRGLDEAADLIEEIG